MTHVMDLIPVNLWDAWKAAAQQYRQYSPQSEAQMRDDFEAWLGEDVVELPEEDMQDLDLVYKHFHLARQELVDQAHSGNLQRTHHLESAVACFGDIDTLLQAEGIMRAVLDIRELDEDPTPVDTEEVDTEN